jgi:glycosyltransferase involved in cell wall biosynthesis
VDIVSFIADMRREAGSLLRRASGRRRVLICSNAYPPRFTGGAEVIAHQQAKALQRAGCEVIVFAGESNSDGERYAMRRDTYDGLTVYRVCLHPADYGTDHFNFVHRRVHDHFQAVADAHPPDIVHFHNLVGLSAGLLRIAQRRRIKSVLTLHDYWGICFKNTLMKTAGRVCTDSTQCHECMPLISGERWTGVPIRMRRDFIAHQLDAVDVFVSPSAALAETYVRAGIGAGRMRIVWYGVDVARFAAVQRQSDPETVRISFIGYLGGHKGVRTIIEALALLDRKDRIRVNVVGGGDEQPALMQRVREIGWEHAVRFWGQVDHARIEEVYRETDVLLLPSIWPENQPVSITEAMAARIPVIASRIGGIPELIDDGTTGHLFEPGNAAQLADKMAACIANGVQLEALGDNAFRTIAANTVDNQVQKILAVYDEPLRSEAMPAVRKTVVACAGKRVHAECSQTVDLLCATSPRGWCFMMADWLDVQDWREALVLWVVDDDAGIDQLMTGLRYRLPLLVPAANGELKDLCKYMECGLSYRTSADVVAALRHLANNEGVRRRLGQNGFNLWRAAGGRRRGAVRGMTRWSARLGA